MGIILSLAILVLAYIAKIFYPALVIEVAQNENISKIGHYIDNNKWLYYIVSTSISMVIYFFICCACCKKKSLNKKEWLIIFIANILLNFAKEFMPSQYTALNICSMIILPCIFKADFLATTTVFTILNFVQTITLEIRGLIKFVSDYNYATLFVLLIDYYIVQVLLYFAFNFKKGEEYNGN